MRHFILEYFHRCEENKDTKKETISAENKTDANKQAKWFLANFFGDAGKYTKKDKSEQGVYWSDDGGECVEFISLEEIPESDYLILQKYGV